MNDDVTIIIEYKEDGARVIHVSEDSTILSLVEAPQTVVVTDTGATGPRGIKGDKGDIGDQGPRGLPGTYWAGDYSETAQYSTGALVLYQGSVYICISDLPSIGILPTDDPTYWNLFVEAGKDGNPGASTDVIATTTKTPTGFPNLEDSTVSFSSLSRSISISPTIGNGTYDVWIGGTLFVKHNTESVVIPNLSGCYIAYFDLDGTLKVTTSLRTLPDGCALVMALVWNATAQAAVYVGEERHSIRIPWATHRYLNDVLGAQYIEGFDLTTVLNGQGETDTELTIALSNGTFADEDLYHECVNSSSPQSFFEQVLSPVGHFPILYRQNDEWRKSAASPYPLMLGARPYFNVWSGSSWSIAEAQDSSFIAMWLMATTNRQAPLILIQGQANSTDIEEVLDSTSIQSMKVDGLPFEEFKPLYRLVYFCSTSLGNSIKAKLVRVEDYRRCQSKFDRPVINLGAYNWIQGGDKHYRHEQGIASTQWAVNHGLNKVPAISVLDTGGTNIEGDIIPVDLNTVRLVFSHPFTGTAFCN